RAPALHDMPVHADVDWREAQLGQLSRLLVGSDEGWRGNLTGELHLDGTPGAAHVATRLQATGVHRAEFVPLSPLDFDANCSFVYHYRRRALDDLVCNSPLGDGHLRLAGKLQASQMPELTAELDRIPAEAGLDVLRATRSGIAPSLQAAGSISGSLVYRAAETDSEPIRARARRGRGHAPALRGEPLRGALTVEGFALSGGSLSLPLRAEKFVLEPAPASALNAHEPVMLAGTASFPAGGSAPLDVELHLAMKGYEAEIHGETSLARAREIEKTAGMGGRLIPDGLAGELMAVDLRASGPWQLSDQNAVSGATSGPEADTADSVDGTATLRGAQWRSDLLANPVEIAEATLHFGGGELRWDPVDFSYGRLKARASITFPQRCPSPEDTAGSPVSCVPQFQLQLGSVDAASAQAAFLGVPQKGTVLSELLDRLHPATAPPWPRIDGTVKADAMVVGPVTLRQTSMTLKIAGNGADFSDLQASLLGGQVTAHGSVQWSNGIQKQPTYSVEARCTGLNAAGIGQLLGVRGTGGPVDASGTASLSGFTEEQLANSAAGTLQFDWRHGSISAAGTRKGSSAKQAQAPLIRFDRWSGEARIANGRITLQKNQLIAGGRRRSVEAGQVTLSDPPKVEIRPGK
ncbi:MAG: AsmA-like C-terminal region-containing protein, partial [Acidobacteriota bacterium]